MAKQRVFVGVEASQEIWRYYRQAKDQLGEFDQDLKWVGAENLHLTLNFLGWVKPEVTGQIRAALAEVARHNQPFNLKVQPVLSAYPSRRNPRVLLFPIEESQEFERLQQLIVNRLQASRVPIDPQYFKIKPPHLTLARTRKKTPRKVQQQLAANIQSAPTASAASPTLTLPITVLTLWHSQLTPTGAEYYAIEHFALHQPSQTLRV